MTLLGRHAVGMLGAERTIVLSNAQQVVASSLPWGPGVWASPKPKKLIVPSGVVVGSTSISVPALTIDDGWGGQLTLIVNGIIDGAGGVNSGDTGGTALRVEDNGENKARVLNSGELNGGGGAGSIGGQGGPGVYPVLTQEGPFYSPGAYYYQYSGFGFGLCKIVWGGSVLLDQWDGGHSQHTIGSVTYYRGANQGGGEMHAIYRRYNVNTPSVGGAGGANGRGAGYSQSATSGQNGSAGGPNAGTGGRGGDGGGKGQSGQDGQQGSAGNAGSGLASPDPGLGGFWIDGEDFVDYEGAGITRGRTQ